MERSLQNRKQRLHRKTTRYLIKVNRSLTVKYEYYLFYKPAGCVTATEDQLHKTVMDYLTDTVRSDLFPVGRLDIDTEGLLLITNDGLWHMIC